MPAGSAVGSKHSEAATLGAIKRHLSGIETVGDAEPSDSINMAETAIARERSITVSTTATLCVKKSSFEFPEAGIVLPLITIQSKNNLEYAEKTFENC